VDRAELENVVGHLAGDDEDRDCGDRSDGVLGDLIFYTGDVCTAAVLDELSDYAPVRVVRGNNDGMDVAAWGAPETLELDLAGLAVANRAFPHTSRPGCR